ncbi:MAG: hypothetical protein H6737_31625 [Alphaproteobacteria bacterium]|nr:hypothetical protein [Alphaproteobacteria bacterium]
MRSRFTTAPARLRAPDDGIVTSSRSGGWVSDRWLKMLSGLERTHGPRLSQGRNFARNGRVRGLWFSPGLASAQVVADEYYNVSIRFRVFGDAEWDRILAVLVDNLLNIASLLEGHLPFPLFEELEKHGIALLPTLDEIDGDCNCGDYMLPCSHMSAVHHVLAEAIDGEPFLLFTLRGRPRAQLLAELRKLWGDAAQRNPVSREELAPEVISDDQWASSSTPLPPFDFRFKPSEKVAVGLRALGPPPGDADLVRALEPLYVAGSKAALELAMSDLEVPTHENERVRQFRRSVQRPTQSGTSGGGEQSDLTAAIVDALAETECAKSKELADRVGADILDVRQELLELEKLGIVYRTGQTRGTRWWLG